MFLAIFFDIDELGAAYGLAAYKLLFHTIPAASLNGCFLSDGDIGERYCIGLESADSQRLFKVEAAIVRSEAPGLAPSNSRLSFDEQVSNYLVPAAYINHQGCLERVENAWVKSAWEANQAKTTTQNLVIDETSGSPSTLIATGAPSSATAAEEYAPGDRIGNDFVIHDIRKGGMGVVYIVEDLKSRAQNIRLRLALKTFQSRYLWNDEAMGRFEREALVWIELGKHPNIVHAMLVQRVANRPYLWLEFIEGQTLAARINQTPLSTREALNYARQFCAGMQHAHANHGVIHRDVKPANILIDKNEVLKITDFGLSRLQAELVGEALDPGGGGLSADELETVTGTFATAAGQCLGTPAYIAPEAIVAPQTVDVRTDIYSFGIVLYEMLTGARPFTGANILQQHIDSIPARVKHLRPEISAELDRIVARCQEKDPNRRFQNFFELETALREVPESDDQNQTSDLHAVSVPAFGQLFMKGFTLMQFGRYEEAINCFESAIALDDSNHEAFNNLGVCLANLDRMEAALQAIAKAVALKPDYGEGWSNLAGFYERAKRYDEGIEASNRALELKPQWAEAWSNLAANLAGKDRWDEAKAAYLRAIAEDESYWLAYLKLAQLYIDRGAQEEGLQLLRTAIRINPREADLLASMAECLIDIGRTEEALHYLNLALRADSQHPRAVRVQTSLDQSKDAPGSPREVT